MLGVDALLLANANSNTYPRNEILIIIWQGGSIVSRTSGRFSNAAREFLSLGTVPEGDDRVRNSEVGLDQVSDCSRTLCLHQRYDVSFEHP